MPDVEPADSSTHEPTAVTVTAPTRSDGHQGGEIVARRDRAHWIKRCVLIPGLILFCGLYFLYDGYVGYPNENRRFDELSQKAKEARDRGDAKAQSDFEAQRKSVTRHEDLDIWLQKVLGYALPPLGVLAFVFFSRQSRGQYRLAGDVLYAPGHPPVPLDAIRQIDKTKWDKKGIAYVEYEIEPAAGGRGASGRVRLDDALYEQQPTTAILKTIEARVAPEAEEPAVPAGDTRPE